MNIRQEFRSFGYCGWHKGFYNDNDSSESLSDIRYSDFFVEPNDDEFPYDSAYDLYIWFLSPFRVIITKVAKL